MKHLLLYSTNTWLAFMISKEYYNDVHYVWCSPFFSSKAIPAYDYTNPPSSSPSDIYDNFYADSNSGDLHSARIKGNRVGIIRGANKKARAGIISEQQKREIYSIVKQSESLNFRPLLYVIPFALVEDIAKIVPLDQRASAFSVEYIIENLPRSCFDVLEYRA
ncbi:MAG TPA: hypothetical protein VK363_16180 [Pyrinomonadaceae bacterium]|nr:hypothetical protein [Pyrinomonadaceae bacterium]